MDRIRTAARFMTCVALISLLCLGSGCATRSIIADAVHPPYRPDSLYEIEHAYSDRDNVLIAFRAFLSVNHPDRSGPTARPYWLKFAKTDVRIKGHLKSPNKINEKLVSYEHVLRRRSIHKGLPDESVTARFKEIPVLKKNGDHDHFSGYPDFVITSLPKPELEAVFQGKSGIGYGLSFHYVEPSGGNNDRITEYCVSIKERKKWTESIRSLSGLPFTLVLDAVFLPVELFFIFED